MRRERSRSPSKPERSIQNNAKVLHHNLFRSDVYGANLLLHDMREIRVGINAGGLYGMDTTSVTQDFGRPRSDRFLTGAAYSEHDGDDFDYVGEGGIRFRAGGHCTAFEGVGPKLQF